jgi:hypothetical protein
MRDIPNQTELGFHDEEYCTSSQDGLLAVVNLSRQLISVPIDYAMS